jgi:hypothetical protein
MINNSTIGTLVRRVIAPGALDAQFYRGHERQRPGTSYLRIMTHGASSTGTAT